MLNQNIKKVLALLHNPNPYLAKQNPIYESYLWIAWYSTKQTKEPIASWMSLSQWQDNIKRSNNFSLII